MSLLTAFLQASHVSNWHQLDVADLKLTLTTARCPWTSLGSLWLLFMVNFWLTVHAHPETSVHLKLFLKLVLILKLVAMSWPAKTWLHSMKSMFSHFSTLLPFVKIADCTPSNITPDRHQLLVTDSYNAYLAVSSKLWYKWKDCTRSKNRCDRLPPKFRRRPPTSTTRSCKWKSGLSQKPYQRQWCLQDGISVGCSPFHHKNSPDPFFWFSHNP